MALKSLTANSSATSLTNFRDSEHQAKLARDLRVYRTQNGLKKFKDLPSKCKRCLNSKKHMYNYGEIEQEYGVGGGEWRNSCERRVAEELWKSRHRRVLEPARKLSRPKFMSICKIRRRIIPEASGGSLKSHNSVVSLKFAEQKPSWLTKRPFRCGSLKHPCSKGILRDPYICLKQDKNRLNILNNFKVINKLLRNGFIKAANARKDIKNNLISLEEYKSNITEMDKVTKLLNYMKQLTCTRNIKIIKSPPA
ncbi:unnamed protein product [Moneuplotes crassus]|uniref:Uncharacterized protein n=1 Tax=Euplotes crassus TaxID=5936 RepID=A0AAD1UTY9_EUPCR|nr:unnamed protein product [Moneuplotes crassus]